ncbi:MAG: ABC transporter ATP-binding protein [Candidatus Leucobacter sulfamidivorax]|nr:ABC transporter ATP-binding protein [Candidatus Leucobacter sulfamidivorax]
MPATPSLPTPPRSRDAAHLAVSGVSRSFAGRRVLSDISFTARAGDRVGLIGENGTGKSTLLRILGGLDRPDVGTVSHAASHGSLAQELPYPSDAPIGRVLDDAQQQALAARDAVERTGAALARDPDDPALPTPTARRSRRPTASARGRRTRAEARRSRVSA